MKNLCVITLILLALNANSQTITTVAGNGVGGYTGDGVAATATKIYSPYDVGMDSLGNMFIGDAGNNRIRRVNTSGIISTVAGNGIAGYNGDGIIATNAKLDFPYGMAVNRSGVIVISDMNNQRIRSIQSESGGTISTIGGTGVAGFSGDGGPAISAKIYDPQGIFWDAANNVYFSDHSNHRIRKIDAGGIITTIAGTGTAGFSGDGGAATAAQIYYPSGITADSVGNIYFADMYNHRIRRISTSGIITTVAGTGTGSFSGDGGAATLATIRYPKGVCIDRLGNIIIADTDNQLLRKVNIITGIITTIAGTGVMGYSGDGGPATLAKLNYNQGVYVDVVGSIYIGDCDNHRVRKIECIPPAVSAITGLDTVCMGGTIALASATSGGTWSSSNTNATVVGTGVVTGVTVGLVNIVYRVTNTCAAVAVTHAVYVKSCATTGINRTNATQPFIYPNPATNKLTVSSVDKIIAISITNSLGQVVYTRQHNSLLVNIDITNLPKGAYFIKVNDGAATNFVKN